MRKNWSIDKKPDEAELNEEIRRKVKENESKLEKKNSVRSVRRLNNKREEKNFRVAGSKCHACGKC